MAIARLWLDGHEVALDSEAFATGWHAPEPECRWTNGDATLTVAGKRIMEFELLMTGTYWRDEAQPAAAAMNNTTPPAIAVAR